MTIVKQGFEPGIVREITIRVTEEMCPSFDGVIVHRCYSTWSVVHHMEIAARKVLVGFLEEHEEGIGTHVQADHLAPCPVGREVRVRAELVEVTGDRHPRVICDVQAFDGERLLATGRQIQVVMNKSQLEKHIAQC